MPYSGSSAKSATANGKQRLNFTTKTQRTPSETNSRENAENTRIKTAHSPAMIELQHDQLRFSFPDLHAEAHCTVSFQRTLRIPDDDKTWPLPPGLGQFPIVHVDDYAANLPSDWYEHGGVAFRMYQSEAMWLSFSRTGYPFAVKVAAGKIDATTGETWSADLRQEPQNYLLLPTQPWLDGFAIKKGVIRQFVAMPLGSGYSAEEQITGKAEHGGLQIQVYPMRAEIYKERIESERIGTNPRLPLCRTMRAMCCRAEYGLSSWRPNATGDLSG